MVQLNNNEILTKEFWNNRWENKQTGWDIGYASPAIEAYFNQYPNKECAILIPGCGNAYEAAFLLNAGFKNISLIDIAPKAVEGLQQKFGNNPEIKIYCEDFFDHQHKYDIIVEQTFFCTFLPEQRKKYVNKASSLLNNHGKIIGVLFDKIFEQQGPPFGGNDLEYKEAFEPLFVIKTMDKCYNSISPRAGSEFFINLIKK